MSETTNEQPWGRVDENRTVFVREGDSEREVGQFPDGTPEEALAYYERKFADLEGAVTLLEARVARGTAGNDVAEIVTKLQAQLVEPAAIGDLASLRARVEKLGGKASELTEKQQAEREAAKQKAAEQREAIVVEAERLAAQPEASIRWKETGQAFEQLFTDWQASQRSGPQLPKSVADAMWKRFRSARQSFDTARRAHFAQLDATNKDVKHRKERLITQAEALAPRGIDGIPAYRTLLDEWKGAGRASRKLDDQLWARFKAAGDVLYQAKAAEVAQTNEEYAVNLAAKQALLDEYADQLLAQTDRVAARKRLTELQLKWDEIGRVPREAVRDIEGKIRKIEDHVKGLEEEHWRKTNPETKARSEGLRGQLETSIAELKAEIAHAKDAKSKAEAEQKLATQESWLAAIGD
ncbi:DUF349 domain-containing protein [Leucobacter sp. UT-8R-CII-1-4]|uniref:DUF349 domain-containing protein n=1 Tax=Leucobacter sp. UT-8R-CII-1-4 TaxID=3040075 RepID=UPI0024A8147E|nr:DUF349 domain-containing protein [Leucobacter sp. UT-8R-CII-1-4]MDI6024186.1 DUF349 domain-containing protein [Leucobacter sp. UT-8R-CII-1-4]